MVDAIGGTGEAIEDIQAFQFEQTIFEEPRLNF
jgi:hypothetical protein